MKALCITLLIALISTITISAQTGRDKDASDSQVIARVDVRGNRRFSRADIRSWISTHKHDDYSAAKLDSDVRALFDTGHFSDVKVYVEGGLHGGKIITFEVMDRPLILNIFFEGIDASKQNEARAEWHKREIELSAGSEYNPVKIRKAAKAIQEWLNNQPDNLRVIPYVDQQSPIEVSVRFKIEKRD